MSNIKKLLREGLNKIVLIENRNTKLLKVAMNHDFEDIDVAKKHLSNKIKFIDNLPSQFNLYRIIFVNNEKEIDRKHIGSHYVFNKNELTNTHQNITHVGKGSGFMLTVRVNKNNIDVDSTLLNQMKYPHENEVTMKNKGLGGNIIKIEPLNKKSPEDDFSGDFDEFSDTNYDDYNGY